VIDLCERTVSPGFIDTHVYLTMDAANIALQTFQSSNAKALKRLSLTHEYMNYGFTTLCDLGSVDPEWPTIDLRIALNTGLVEGPRPLRRRAYYQRERRPWRSPRVLCLALDIAGLGDRR